MEETGREGQQFCFLFSAQGAGCRALQQKKQKGWCSADVSQRLGAPSVSQPASLTTSSRWGCPGAQLKGAREPEVISGQGLETAVHISPGGGLLGPRRGAVSQTQKGKRPLGAGARSHKISFFI